ncbi:MAG TPA: TonB-dependent receptor [Ignavibacteria bacterium]|nr:TonB-dependent receptor [Ignavibacteria bacterium]
MKKLITVFLLFFSIYPALSQQKGILNGIVLDKSTQTFLKDINVKILGTELTAKTKEDGSFRIIDIPLGTYSVEFTSASYQKLIQSDVIISPGSERELIVELGGVQTDEVVIEDSRFQKPSDVTTSFKSLTFEEIRRFPGGLEDIGRVIQSLPGISLSSDGRNDLLVRGGSPAENLFVVDGFEVSNINHFGSQGATGGPVSVLNLDFVRNVNFLTGGFSAKYGDKLSSVVEIDQRAGNSEKFFGKINLSGTGFGANFEGPISKKNKSSWLISARRSYLDLIFNAAGFSFVPEYTDFQAKADYRINDKNSIEFNSFGALDKVRFNNDTEEKKQNNLDILTNNQNSYSAGFLWKTLLSGNSYLVSSVARNYTNFFFSQRDSNFNEIFRNDSKESDIQLKLDYSSRLSQRTLISFGGAGKRIKLNYDIDKKADTLSYIDPKTGNYFILPAVRILDNQYTYKGYAYAEIVQSFLNRFKFTAGLRYDYFDLIYKKNYLSPRTSLAITITPKLSFNLAYGIFYQSPSYIWIVGSENNKNLEDIRADHYIAGFEYLFDESTRLTVEGYFKEYKNYPVSVNRPYLILANNSGFETQNSFGLEELVSKGTGKAIGFEIFLQKALTKKIYSQASFSYSDVKYKAYDGIERRSDWDNRYVVNISGGYKLGKSWELSAKFRLAGGRPYTPINPADGSINYDLYNTEVLPVYHRLDVRAEKKFMFKAWTLTTYIDIQNIYNRQNVYEYKWDPFKKEIETNKNLGILPTIGISAEF